MKFRGSVPASCVPLPFPPRRLGLSERAIEVILALLLLAHLRDLLAVFCRAELAHVVPAALARRFTCNDALARNALGALLLAREDAVGGLLRRERVLLEVGVPRVAVELVRLGGELAVADLGEPVRRHALVEGGPLALVLGFRFRLGLVGGRALAQRLDLALQLANLMAQVRGRGAVFGRLVHVAHDLAERVAEELLQRRGHTAIILARVGDGGCCDVAILRVGGIVDARVLGDPLRMLGLVAFERRDLFAQLVLRLADVLAVFELGDLGVDGLFGFLVELGRGLLLVGLVLLVLLVRLLGVVVLRFGLFALGKLAVRGAAARLQRAVEVELALFEADDLGVFLLACRFRLGGLIVLSWGGRGGGCPLRVRLRLRRGVRVLRRVLGLRHCCLRCWGISGSRLPWPRCWCWPAPSLAR